MSRPRIIGGSARGRELETPASGTRPTPSRLREAVFDSLQFRERGSFLDLFGGSGAMGLEAASRGFAATLVELSPAAAAVISRNARRLGLDARVVRGDALEFVRREGGFDIVFAAPPYPLDLEDVFGRILRAGPARPGGLYILQHPTSLHLGAGVVPEGAEARRRSYGSNTVTVVSAGG